MQTIIAAVLLVIPTALSQLANIYGKANTRDCESWEDFSRSQCFWFEDPDKRAKKRKWNKPYFDQLSPTCQATSFYQKVKNNYATAVENVLNYFKLVAVNDGPCGYCSYKQSCGSRCRGSGTHVRENRCTSTINDSYGRSYEPNRFCKTEAQYFGTLVPQDCKIWPTDLVDLSTINSRIAYVVKSRNFFNCVRKDIWSGTCLCCCHPYVPDLSRGYCVYKEGPDGKPQQGLLSSSSAGHGHSHSPGGTTIWD